MNEQMSKPQMTLALVNIQASNILLCYSAVLFFVQASSNVFTKNFTSFIVLFCPQTLLAIIKNNTEACVYIP